MSPTHRILPLEPLPQRRTYPRDPLLLLQKLHEKEPPVPPKPLLGLSHIPTPKPLILRILLEHQLRAWPRPLPLRLKALLSLHHKKPHLHCLQHVPKDVFVCPTGQDLEPTCAALRPEHAVAVAIETIGEFGYVADFDDAGAERSSEEASWFDVGEFAFEAERCVGEGVEEAGERVGVLAVYGDVCEWVDFVVVFVDVRVEWFEEGGFGDGPRGCW